MANYLCLPNMDAAGDLPFLPLEEGNTIRRRSRGLCQADLVGTNGQWPSEHSQPQVSDCCSSCPVCASLSFSLPD